MELKDPIELHIQRVTALDRRQFLRPLTNSELLERSARIFQVASRSILAQTAIPTLFCFISAIFALTFLIPNLFTTTGGDQLRGEFSRVIVTLAITLFVAIPLFMFGLGQAFEIAIRHVQDYVTGDQLPGESKPAKKPPTPPWRMTGLLTVIGIEAFAPVILASALFVAGALASASNNVATSGFLAFSGVMIALLSLIVCPFLIMRNCLGPVAMAVEGGPILQARRRGITLTHSNRVGGIADSVIVALLVLVVIVIGISFAVTVPLNLLTESGPFQHWVGTSVYGSIVRSTLAALPYYIVLWLMTPFWATFCTVLYFDRRVRIEGFDIRMLAKDVLEVRE